MGLGGGHQYLALQGPSELTAGRSYTAKRRETNSDGTPIIGPGEYEISESTLVAEPTQAPGNMADLLGVFIFSDEPVVVASANPQILLAQTPRPGPRERHGVPKLNDSGTGGSLRIVSGTGSFDSVSDANKVLHVLPGATLNGTVAMEALNLGPGGAIAPLIYTPSWGDPSTSWRLINGWIPTGPSSQQAQLSLTVPSTPGTYHIIFAFAWEKKGDQVASASNWGLGHDVWGDGNDIAALSNSQLSEAQTEGYTSVNWLSRAGYKQQYVPVDALTLEVATNTAKVPPPPPKPPKPSIGGHPVPLARYLVLGAAGLVFLGMAIAVIRLIIPQRGNRGGSSSTEN